MKLIKYIAIPVIASSVTLGALALADEKMPVSTKPVDIVASVPKKGDGTYRQYGKGEWLPDTRVTEYQTDKDVGYQVSQYELRADGTYMRSFGEGPEAPQRSFDWIKISDFATSTP